MTPTKNKLSIVFIGCVQFSEQALKVLLSLKADNISVVGIITKSKSTFNSDHVSLLPFGIAENIPTMDVNDHSDTLNFCRQLAPDVIFCFGWSQLLSKEILTLPPKGVVGFHPTNLPENRGRHPIVWTLALGLTSTASTFFMMDEGADSGPIISQKPVSVSIEDNAKTLYEKIIKVALQQINEFVYPLRDGCLNYYVQDATKANTWRKRGEIDGIIDWRMTADSIVNLVRALYHPYVGAEFLYHGEKFKVWQSEIFNKKIPKNIIPGTVLAIENRNILVKSADTSAVWLKNIHKKVAVKVGDHL
ncbi:formyltransferase family protein [Thalassotalea piscium]|uniref:Methionyl-tRNA formyltransferase n=1 Tax=Thalassotalea piscium TaxID=1230533 RepID=A0A7X0TV17_9GAMM|nr:formyltransferase family protein [Thalassotalea piscium]MBB6544709.1 methionyl-tRNA formyltransferase [Thalassotalea piscium]